MKKEKIGGTKNPLMYDPFGDVDKDRVPNVLDCAPLDPTKHGLWDWVKSRVVTPIYRKIYTPIIKPPLVATQRVAQRTIQQYIPTVSYTRAGERRAAARRYIERKPAAVVRKLKKRIPEKEKLAMFAIKRAPMGMVSTHLIKQLPQFRKLKPDVVTPRIPTVVPGRMGLLAGAEVVTPVLREKVITPIRRGYEKIKGVGVYSTTFGYIKPSKEPPVVPSKEPPRFKDILFEPTKVHFGIHGKLYKRGEEVYHRKITEPLGVWIAGEKTKERVEQEVRIGEAVKKIGELERKEWMQPSGEFILPRILKSEVHKTEGEVKKLEKFALEKGWQDISGRITYPDTVEGRDWVKTYETKIKEHEKYITPEGYYKEEYLEYTPESKSYVEAITSYEKEKAKLGELPKAARTRRFLRGAGEVAVGIPGFVALTTPRIISETIVAPKAAPSKAVMFGKGFYEFAKTEPYRAAGGLAVMAAIPAARKLPVKPKVTVARFPGATAYSLGIETVRHPGFLRRGGYGEFYPAVTVGKGAIKRVSIGEPKIIGELLGKTPKELRTPFEVRTPLEARIIAKVIPEEALKITEARGVRYYTIKAGVKPKELKPIFEETLKQHGLTKSTDTVIKLMRKEKADLYGSISQKAAGRRVGEPGLERTPRDFDVKVANEARFAKNAIKKINKAEGYEAVILKKGKVIVKKTGDKLFDIHPKEEPSYGILGEDYIGYGMKEEPLIKTLEGIRTTTLSRQATRKLTAAQMITGKLREYMVGGERLSTQFRGMKYVTKFKDKLIKGHPKGDKSIISGKTNNLQFHHIVKTGKGEAGVQLTYNEHVALHAAMGHLGKAIGSDTLFYKLFKERASLTPKDIQNILKNAKSKQVRNEVNYILKELKAREADVKPFTIKGRIMPEHKGRVKDIGDYYFAEKANIAGLKLKGRVLSAKKAEVHLEKWLDSWGKDIKKLVKDSYKETIKEQGGEKAWLGSFDIKPISPIESYKMVSQVKYVAPVSAIPPVGIVPYQIPSVISEISVRPSVIPSAIPPSVIPSAIPSKIPSAIPSELPSIIPTKPSVISEIPSGSRILSGIDSKITSIFDGYKQKPYKPKIYKPSLITGKPYKPKIYKPKVYKPYSYKPYSYKPYPYTPYTPPSKGEYPFMPFIYEPAPPVTKPHIIPKDEEEIKKLRREPWAAIQTSVRNPILTSDELIKKML